MNEEYDTGEINSWVKLLTGEITDENEKQSLLGQGVEALDTFLKTDPQAEQRVVEILGRRLSGDFNADTFEVMHSSLRQYFGEDLAYMLYWVVAVEDPEQNRMPEVEKLASSEVMAFLRTVVGIYGPDLTNAYTLWNKLPNNWRTVQREVFYDLLNERPHLIVRIKKYSGEQTVIEGPPDSILDLASYLVYTARLCGTREAFSQESIERFVEMTQELAKLLSVEEEKEPAELTHSDNTT